MSVMAVDDLNDPRLEPFRQLKRTNATRDQRTFVVEGLKLVERLLASSLEVVCVLVDGRHRPLVEPQVPADVPLLVVPDGLVEPLVGFNFHRGVLACGRRPGTVAWEDVVAGMNGPRSLVVCPQINDPVNLGTLLRTAAAFDVDAVIVGRSSADVYSRRVLRVSMGAPLARPPRVVDDVLADLERLADAGVTRIATVLDSSATLLDEFRVPRRWALVLGNEGHGLPPDVIERCDARLTIPMPADVDSLNVAVSGGIFLHYLRRQRHGE